MRYKQALSGILAGVIAVSGICQGMAVTAHAAEDAVGNPVPTVTYDFNGELGEDTKAVVTGLGEYDGDIVYGEGRSAEDQDQAVRLGDYGLKLNQNNLGDHYTVSMWIHPEGASVENSPVLFLGYHDPEKWVAVSGNDTLGNFKLWTNDSQNNNYNWKGIASTVIPSGEWSMLTITGNGESVTGYINGRKIGEGTAANALKGENQDIYLGVSFWDHEFTGLVDDVAIYSETLNAAQVRGLYENLTPEEILAKDGFAVQKNATILKGKTLQLKAELPTGVTGEDVDITYQSNQEKVASVDSAGLVTALKAGTAEITTTVTAGVTTKSEKTVITVNDPGSEASKEIAVEYSMTGAEGGKIADVSGNGNDGEIVNPDGVSFITENGNSVMDITGTESYVKLPSAIMDTLSDQEQFTMEMTYARRGGNNAWLFCLGSKIQGTGTNYFFYSPSFTSGSKDVRSGIKNSSNEILFENTPINADNTYYTAFLVFDKGTISLYMDGMKVDEKATGYSIMNDVVNPGTADGVLGYLGRSCWSGDGNYQGKISSFKIHNKAMSAEDIINTNPDYVAAVQKKLDSSLTEGEILGNKNATVNEVAYDLNLPEKISGMDVVWTSSDPETVTEDGTVRNGSSDRQVVLTAKMATAEKKFTVTVKALRRTDLDSLCQEAQAMLDSFLTEASESQLRAALELSKNADTQTKAELAIAAINRAIGNLEFMELFKNPWDVVKTAEPEAKVSMKISGSALLFTLPEAVEDYVTVSYSSSAPDIVKYENGKATALKDGSAVLTAAVTSGFDGYTVKYVTIASVEGAQQPVKTDLSGVAVKAAKDKMAKGSSAKVQITYPAGIQAEKVNTSFKASGAVSVDASGKITGKKAGTGKVTVTLSADGISAERTITVKVGTIAGKSSVRAKKSLKLKVQGISGKAVWSVNKKKLASVNKKGVLKAKKKGKIVVTAKAAGVTMKKAILIK